MKDQTMEELVDSLQKAKAVIEDTEAAMKVIKDEMLDRLKAMKLTGVKTKNGFFVRSVSMTSFTDVPMAWAKEQGAVYQKEALDLTMLKKLVEKGVKIPKIKYIRYIKVEEEK